MKKETYERLAIDVTEFDVEDVITTSGVNPGHSTNEPPFDPTNPWEMPVSAGL